MENKTGKYFKYAIGEIILVVIGILIALSINNWNEEHKKSINEVEYLSNLLDEFNTNQETLNTIIKNHKFVKLKTKKLSELMKPNPEIIAMNKLDTLMYAMMYHPKFIAHTSLMFSDKLELVNDYKLKNDIAYWKLTYDEYNYGLKINYDQYLNHTHQFIKENYQIKNIKSSRFENDKSLFPVDVEPILSNPIFENQVMLKSLNEEVIFRIASKLYDLQEIIIKNIELKIKNKK